MSQLRRAGATLFNQAVLLAGINDNEQDLSQLDATQFQRGRGTLLSSSAWIGSVVPARFDTDRQMAVQLIDALRVQLSGYLGAAPRA